MTDSLGLTRPRDGKPLTWPFAFCNGLWFGVFMGAVLGLKNLGVSSGFSWEAFFISVVFGVVAYAPLAHWISHRNSKL